LASIFNIDVLEVLLVAMKPHLSNVLEILFIIILKKKLGGEATKPEKRSTKEKVA
jgi:hypothetical protein